MARSVLTMSHSMRHGSPFSSASSDSADELVVQSDVKRVILLADVVGGDARAKIVSRRQDERQVNVLRLGSAKIFADLESSAWPTISLTVRKPSLAMIARSSLAM